MHEHPVWTAALRTAMVITLVLGAPTALQAEVPSTLHGARTSLLLDEDDVPMEAWDRGADENPVPPDERRRQREDTVELPTGYPMELARRPLILDPGMWQITLDMPTHVSPARARSLLRADHSLTDQIQLGLGYGPGAVSGDGFTPGKAVSLEFRYLVTSWLSAQASVPMLFDPFSMGITLGAPMKFRFTQRFAMVFGHDFLSVRVARFVPHVDDPQANEELAAAAAINTRLDRGALRFLGGAIYQLAPDLAFFGEIGLLAFDFGLTRAGIPLRATLLYHPREKVDLGVRLGFDNLDDATYHFGATFLAALRI